MQRPILGPVLASLGVLLLLAAGHLLPDLFPPELDTIEGRLQRVEVEGAATGAVQAQPGLARGVVLLRLAGQPLRFRFPLGLFGDAEDIAARLSDGRWVQLAVARDGLEASRRANAWYQRRITSAAEQAQAAYRSWRTTGAAAGNAVPPVTAYEITSGPTIIASRIAFDVTQTALAGLAFALGVIALLAGFRFGAYEDEH